MQRIRPTTRYDMLQETLVLSTTCRQSQMLISVLLRAPQWA